MWIVLWIVVDSLRSFYLYLYSRRFYIREYQIKQKLSTTIHTHSIAVSKYSGRSL